MVLQAFGLGVCVFFGLEFRAPIVRTPGRFVPWPYTKLPALVETLSGRIRIWGLGFGVYRGLGVQGLKGFRVQGFIGV